MGLQLLNQLSKKRDQIVAIDLGTRTTKAVHIQRAGEGFKLLNYSLQAAPIYEKNVSPEVLTEHLKSVVQTLGNPTRHVVLAVGVGDTVLRHVELPKVTVADMRNILRVNTKLYFQQELPDYVFDCCVPRDHSADPHKPAEKSPVTEPAEIRGEVTSFTAKSSLKSRVLVGGLKSQVLGDLQTAVTNAGLIAEEITFSQISPVNAFLAFPKAEGHEVMALVDVGFRHSTISILVNEELVLTRVLEIGAQNFTSGLAEAVGISYPAAEGAILVLTKKVQSKLKTLLAPLGQELRASIDFFEHEMGKHVSEVLISGGSACSEFIIQTLQAELMVPSQTWIPTRFLTLELPQQQMVEVERDAPQLVAAIGAAMHWFSPSLIRVNLLAEQQEAAELRRRDPVKRGFWAAAVLVLLMLAWGGILGLKLWSSKSELAGYEAELTRVQKSSSDVVANLKKTVEIERTLASLNRLAAGRFLWALPLNALQFAMVDNIQIIRLKLQQDLVSVPGTPATTTGNRVTPGKPASSTEKITLVIQAKDSADPPAAEKFIETIAASPYFKSHLRKTNPVSLKDRSPPQADPSDPAKTFILFTIECYFQDRAVRDE